MAYRGRALEPASVRNWRNQVRERLIAYLAKAASQRPACLLGRQPKESEAKWRNATAPGLLAPTLASSRCVGKNYNWESSFCATGQVSVNRRENRIRFKNMGISWREKAWLSQPEAFRRNGPVGRRALASLCGLPGHGQLGAGLLGPRSFPRSARGGSKGPKWSFLLSSSSFRHPTEEVLISSQMVLREY